MNDDSFCEPDIRGRVLVCWGRAEDGAEPSDEAVGERGKVTLSSSVSMLAAINK